MKNIYLLLFISVFWVLNIHAQVFQSENFDGLTVGNVGTDVTGAVSGQGGLFTLDNTAQNSDFQIVDDGGSQGQVLQITGSENDTGTKFVWIGGLNTDWGNRTSGNDILEVEFDFFTGPATTSKNVFEVRIFNASFETLGGFSYTPENKTLIGLGRLDDMGTPTLFGFNLGASNTAIVLNENTWYRMGLAFDKTTGNLIWKGPGFYAGIATVDVGADPIEVDFMVFAGTLNTVAFDFKLDNYRVRAVNTEGLLGIGDFKTDLSHSVTLFPNPFEDVLNVSFASSITPTKMELIDLNGRLIKTITPSSIDNNAINTSNLNKGLYVLNVYSAEGKASKKVIKK